MPRHIMRTSIEISDALLRHARRVIARRRVTLRQLVEDGLRQVLAEPDHEPFRLRDATFDGEFGFAPNSGPAQIAEVLQEMREPKLGR